VRALCSIGEAERASGLLRAETDVVYTRDRHSVITARAIVSEAKGEVNQALRLYEDTAERWHQHGFVLEEGHALLGVGRCQIPLGRTQDASARLHEARDVFVKLGATPLIDETDYYVQQATALSS
jgi:hypothetical protein